MWQHPRGTNDRGRLGRQERYRVRPVARPRIARRLFRVPLPPPATTSPCAIVRALGRGGRAGFWQVFGAPLAVTLTYRCRTFFYVNVLTSKEFVGPTPAIL